LHILADSAYTDYTVIRNDETESCNSEYWKNTIKTLEYSGPSFKNICSLSYNLKLQQEITFQNYTAQLMINLYSYVLVYGTVEE
jgi:hypothetical protein